MVTPGPYMRADTVLISTDQDEEPWDSMDGVEALNGKRRRVTFSPLRLRRVRNDGNATTVARLMNAVGKPITVYARHVNPYGDMISNSLRYLRADRARRAVRVGRERRERRDRHPLRAGRLCR